MKGWSEVDIIFTYYYGRCYWMSKQKCITVITAITLFFCTLFLLNDSNEVSEVFEEVDLSLALDPFLIPTEWDLLSIKEIKEKK